MPNVLSVLHCIIMFQCCIIMVKGSNFHECKSVNIIHLWYLFKINFQQITKHHFQKIKHIFVSYEISYANKEGGPPT